MGGGVELPPPGIKMAGIIDLKFLNFLKSISIGLY